MKRFAQINVIAIKIEKSLQCIYLRGLYGGYNMYDRGVFSVGGANSEQRLHSESSSAAILESGATPTQHDGRVGRVCA